MEASARAMAALAMKQEEEQAKEKKSSGKRSRWINPIVENFKRTKKGRALMAQEMTRLIREQAKAMSAKALLDVNGKVVAWQYKGDKGSISLQELVEKTPVFFDAFFQEVRNKLMFGSKCQS